LRGGRGGRQRKVAAAKARSIIAVTPEGMPADAADARMIRIILSIRKRGLAMAGLGGHIVAELQDIDNKPLAQIAGGDAVEIVVSHDRIGSVMLLASRSPWLALVLDSLVGFAGSEFYLKEWPALTGLPFSAVTNSFDDAVVVGFQRAGQAAILLNPPRDTRVGPGDRILVLAEDDSSYAPTPRRHAPVRPHLRPPPRGRAAAVVLRRAPERLLFCGWRRDMADMIRELDYDVPPGSELWLLNRVPMTERACRLLDKGNKEPLALRHLQLRHVVGNPAVRRDLMTIEEVSDGAAGDGLRVGHPTGRRETLDYFTSILLLSDEFGEGDGGEEVSGAEAVDSRTVATKLIVQDLQATAAERRRVARALAARAGGPEPPPPPPPCGTITEILDIRTRNLFQGLREAALAAGGVGVHGQQVRLRTCLGGAMRAPDRRARRVPRSY
jgi:hypothetical protein